MQLTSVFLKGDISTAVLKFSEVWKNYSDETKHRQTPTQTHSTKLWVRDDQPFLPSRREGSGHQLTLCNRLHTVHASWKQHMPTAVTCQVLLNSWILSPCSSCPSNLPSTTSQENSQLPIELHSWAIIINFWPSIINVLQMCLLSKYRDTSNSLPRETRFGLVCSCYIFAPGYVKFKHSMLHSTAFQFGPVEMLLPKSCLWVQLTAFSGISHPGFNSTQQAFEAWHCMENSPWF